MNEKNKNISITDFCKLLNIKRNSFISYLINHKYIYIQYYGSTKDNRKNISFPKYDTENGNGLFEMNKTLNTFNSKNNINLQITEKGQKFFKDLLRKERLINGDNEH